MGDLISRSKLHTTILRQPHRVIDDREYVSRDAVLAKIRMAPSVDAVEVVRCRECKHLLAPKVCANPMACGWDALEPDDDDFCSRGEKKDGGAE